MAEFERVEKVLHLRIFTHNINIRKFMISCCDLFYVSNVEVIVKLKELCTL